MATWGQIQENIQDVQLYGPGKISTQEIQKTQIELLQIQIVLIFPLFLDNGHGMDAKN
jgi:hypothetical protein